MMKNDEKLTTDAPGCVQGQRMSRKMSRKSENKHTAINTTTHTRKHGNAKMRHRRKRVRSYIPTVRSEKATD